MTMQNDLHPDDERLAAFAAGDADVVGDRALAEHLTACDRCRPIVDDLTLLRSALAALPDLVPSRPLRLIPPVPAPAAPRAGWLEWLRRLAAPAMAAGAGLVLVGAIGASGVANELTARVRDASSLGAASASDSAKGPIAGGTGSVAPGPMTGSDSGEAFGQTGAPRSETDSLDDASGAIPSTGGHLFPKSNNPPSAGEQPWLMLLVGGAGLFGVSAAVRYSLSPRSG